MNSQPLQTLRLPLRGRHLIEASAGTGKTFTIAMLYVRLVLGHGGADACAEGALTPPQILVVTFTEAATQELRDRIRARLAEAARHFRGEVASHFPEQLRALRLEYPEAEWPACAQRLELAAEWMDEAAVSTIHAWCYRMLREHAFDSLSLFSQTLDADQRALLAEVVRDYWRMFYYPLALPALRQVVACWETPEALEKAVKPLLEHVALLPLLREPATEINETLAHKQALLQALKEPWPDWVAQLRDLLAEAMAAKRVNGRMLQANWCTSWLDKLAAWAQDPLQESLDLGKGWERLTPEGMREAWKDGVPLAHPALEAMRDLRAALQALPKPDLALLQHAAHWIAEHFDAARQRAARLGFNDLLHLLAAALAGKNGVRLAQTIRRQFPVALIDEFQDTDPVQYAIFERVYGQGNVDADDQQATLILIGDPKQAIYAFRGADIYTYLKARKAVAGSLYTLDTNFRSTQRMVTAVNHCFVYAEQRTDGSAAFLFRQGAENPVPFHAVQAAGRAQALIWDGAAQQAALELAVWLPETGKSCSKTAYLEQMAEMGATRIVAWLNQGAAGRAGFRQGDAEILQPLQPGDMAVLVNNRTEAAQMRRALAQRGVRSVYLSDAESVFATCTAAEVLRWLQACAAPDDERLLRAALSTSALGLSWAELDQLRHDEDAWEERVVQFKAYREIWRRQGVLPMLRRILFDFACTQRFLQSALPAATAVAGSGERRLTDFLHLAELLQQASFALEGEHALIRFLSEQMAEPAGGIELERRRLRLESDADLVQIVTIHKSKGLEYPLVFLPFIAATRAVKASDLPLKWHDVLGEQQIALVADDEIVAWADHERLAEDLRKLYVALTRAQYLTWLGLAPLNAETAGAVSAADYLLGLPGGKDKDVNVTADYAAAVRQFAEGQPALAVLEQPVADAERYQPAATGCQRGVARRPQRVWREHWWIGSYSALRVAGGQGVAADAAVDALLPEASAQVGHLLELQHETAAEAGRGAAWGSPVLARATAGQEQLSLHDFYKGAQAGSFLHDLLEWLIQQQNQAQVADVRDMIARRCKVRGWEHWVEPLLAWVHQLQTTALPLGTGAENIPPLRLGSLVAARPEMEFCFEARQVAVEQLDALVTRHTLAARPRPRLAADQLNGMLKGYIDLVFEHDGRYYIADYKSNWLGAGDAFYTHEAMDAAIRQHRYDLQYALYLLALHRLLKSRLPGYDYDTHVGGALYLFLRGLGAATAGVHFERPERQLIEALDALFGGNSGEAS